MSWFRLFMLLFFLMCSATTCSFFLTSASFFFFFPTLDRISEVYDVACTESMRDSGHGLYMLGPYVNDLTQECPQLGVRIPRATNSLLTKRKIKKRGRVRVCSGLGLNLGAKVAACFLSTLARKFKHTPIVLVGWNNAAPSICKSQPGNLLSAGQSVRGGNNSLEVTRWRSRSLWVTFSSSR